jgi:hypothetical protein
MPSFDNPFTVQTPEAVPAKEAVELFVPMFGDFQKVTHPGHIFLHGPRGSGKSMIFRYMQPDCQMLLKGVDKIHSIDYLAVYVPLKNCDLKITELARLEGQHASVILNEHFMVMYIATKIAANLLELPFGDQSPAAISETQSVYQEFFLAPLVSMGHKAPALPEGATVRKYFESLRTITETLYTDVTTYLRRIAFSEVAVPFNGPLCGYLDFLLPLLDAIRQLSYMPKGHPPFFVRYF